LENKYFFPKTFSDRSLCPLERLSSQTLFKEGRENRNADRI
jgi:hypothetical protein